MYTPTLLAALMTPPTVARRSKAGLIFVLSLLCFWLGATARGQMVNYDSLFYGDPGDTGFGTTLAASGNTIVVGSSKDNRAYVFDRLDSGWVLSQKFIDPSPNSSADVAIDGDTMVARGTIYVRINGTWTPQQSFTWPNPATALQGDTLVVGTAESNVAAGQVRVYARSGSTWTLQTSFGPDGLETNLGASVALDGDTLIASVVGTGGPYVYVRSGSTWTRQARLPLPNSPLVSHMQVAIEGDTAAVSDPGNKAVYIFTRTGSSWALTTTLTGTFNNFGWRLALDGGILVTSSQTVFYFYAKTSSGWVLAETMSREYFTLSAKMALANQGKLLALGQPNYSSLNGIVEVYRAPPPPPPSSGWKDYHIGPISGFSGSSAVSGNQVIVRGSGADIWDRADQFDYRAESMTGDGAIVARIDSISSGHPWAKVGLMFREDNAASARNVMAFVAAGSPVGMQVRSTRADTTAFTEAPWMGAPLWLMLARSGNVFASYWSTDGENWTPIGSATVDLPATLFVGLAVCSHDTNAITTGTFSGVELVGGTTPPSPPNAPSNLTGALYSGTTVQLQWTDNSSDETGFNIERQIDYGFEVIGQTGPNATGYTDTNLYPNFTYTYRVRAMRNGTGSAASNQFLITTTTPPAGTLFGTDLGTPSVHGSFTEYQGTLKLHAAGTDIWNQSDEGYFVHREVTGDFDLHAQVATLDATHPWAKAGIMVRESLDPQARNLFTMISGSAASGLQVRDAFGGSTSFVESTWVTAPYWVRLTRTGNTFQSFISPDGTTWQLVATRTLALPATLRAGVAATSHDPNVQTQATFSSHSFGK